MRKAASKMLLVSLVTTVLTFAAMIGSSAGEPPEQTIDPLIQQLGSRDVFQIQDAIGKLADIGAPAVPALIGTFETEDWSLVEAAIKALAGIGGSAIPALLEALKSGSPPVRWSAAAALAQDILFESFEHAEAVHYALLDAIKDPDPRVRRIAAQSLWKQNDENSVLAFQGAERFWDAHELIEQLRDADKNVRVEALRSLTAMVENQSLIPDSDAVSDLTESLGDTEFAVRRIAAFTLGQMGTRAAPAIPELLQALQDPEPSVRATAAKALGSIGPAAEGAVKRLEQMLDDPDPGVRGAAAIALTDLGMSSERVVVELRQQLIDIDEDKREVAALELGSAGEMASVAVPELRKLMDDLSPEVRRAAALALGRVGESAATAVPELRRGLKDKDASVRNYSARALGRVGKAAGAAVPDLQAALADPDPAVRALAARSLGQIGFEADDVIPELNTLLSDPNQLARQFAAESLAKISISIKEEVKGLSSKELGKAVADLQSAQESLQAAATSDRENKEEYKNALATVGLALDSLYTEQYGVLYRLFEYPWTLAIVAYLVLLPTIWWLLLNVRPLWLFHINHALEPYEFAAPRALSEKNRFKTRYAILVGFYYFHPRVLDAWVRSQLPVIRASYESKLALKPQVPAVSLPVDLNGETVPTLTAELLRPTFSRQPSCLLIWGEGGNGKEYLADQVAIMAMAEEESDRLAAQPMIPIYIEQELVSGSDKDEKEKGKKKGSPPLPEIVRGQLQNLTRSSQPLSEDVVIALLRRPSILLIVTDLSDKSTGTREQIRPDLPDFPANALLVTSRLDEPLGQVMKTSVRPLRLGADEYPDALQAYAASLGKETLFDDGAIAAAAQQFAGILGKYQVPALIAKLHADRTIAALEASRVGREELEENDRPDNVPELLFAYLNEINPGADGAGEGLDTESVYATVRVVAWECLKQSLRPLSAKRNDILEALGEDDASARLKYLVKPLSLLEVVGATGNRYRFTSGFLAEYFAAMHLVETYRGDEEAWHVLLHHAQEVPGAPGSIRDFLQALKFCCDTAARQVPGFVAEHLIDLLDGKGTAGTDEAAESPTES